MMNLEKKFKMELKPATVDIFHESIKTYHKYLHDSLDFGNDIGLTKKEIKRRLIKCHRLMEIFEEIRFDTEVSHV